MDLEVNLGSEHPYTIHFDVTETQLVRAVFREKIHTLVRQGNPGSVGQFDRLIAEWELNGPRAVKVYDYAQFADEVEDFSQATENAVAELAEYPPMPPFSSNAIGARLKLGEKALTLAEAIRQEGGVQLRLAQMCQVNRDEIEAGIEAFGRLLKDFPD